MMKGNELDVAEIVFEILAKKKVKFVCFIVFSSDIKSIIMGLNQKKKEKRCFQHIFKSVENQFICVQLQSARNSTYLYFIRESNFGIDSSAKNTLLS